MTQNVGSRDRLFRTLFGVYGMLLGFLFIQGVVGIVIGVLGLISLVTGAVGWCGIYALIGRSTVKSSESSAQSSSEGNGRA
ncbi:MAG: DUF2892 domain-containing protein [Anaerolineae bacterium]|jgi:hypothetical protein|nr:DUF2892 domain-containing protein [Anaerolineae bacterium]